MALAVPQRTRMYRNHMLDSDRWDDVTPRDDDVIVATPYKSGTTWTLYIVRELFALREEMPPFREMWVDCRFRQTPEEFAEELEAQTHRRYLKSHLPLDGIRWLPSAKYIVVGRDVRDVFMSFWNHYRAMSELGWVSHINELPHRVGDPLPEAPADVHVAWAQWIGRGWFPWEREGYPFWSNMHHVQTWWEHRHLDNILFIHFNDLKRDVDAQIRRIGRYVGIEPTDAEVIAIREASTVEAMAARFQERGASEFVEAFFRHKGRNGRWRDTLTEAELAEYDRVADEILDPEARLWLETGTCG